MDVDSFVDDFDCDPEPDFIGRSHDLEQLEKAWKSHKLFGVFGTRSVGKSRLVKEFLRRQKENCNSKIRECYIDLKLQTDIHSVHSYICAKLEVEPDATAVESGTWIRQIWAEINKLISSNNGAMVMVFDNAENFVEQEMGDKLKSLFIDLVRHVRRIKVFITCTTKVLFSLYGKTFFNYELLPLTESESCSLLQSIMKDVVDLGEYRDAIIKLSEGLPLLILMIGGELVEDHGMIKPADMVELLSTSLLRTLSREYYGEEDRVADVYKKFIDRLSRFYIRRYAILEFIPGSFNAAEASQMLEYKSEADVKDRVLIHLRRRFLLTFDPHTQRFNIQGILRECVHTYFALNNITDIRRKYCNTFTHVMHEISKQICTEDFTKAVSEFTLEQANLQKLLTEVMFTKEDTYHFFVEIATNCTHLIENFMAGQSEKFYQGCLQCTEMYGKPRDKSIIHIALGSLYTNVKGDFPKGAENLHSALDVLERGDKDINLATAYQRLGWNLYIQGRPKEAVGYLEKSISITSRLGKAGEALMLQSLSTLGICKTLSGNLREAERYHFRVLEIRKASLGENHPFVGATLNNIGLVYNELGDSEKALKYFSDGLKIKSLSKQTPVKSVVLSLNNIAAEHSRLKQFTEAHQKLDEAMDLLQGQEVLSQEALGLLHDTRGKVLQAEKQFRNAAKQFEQAIKIRSKITPDGIVHVESLVHAARSYCSLKEYNTSLKYADKALAMKEKACETMPQNTFINECLEVIAEVYRRTNNDKKYVSTLGKIESELLRLEAVNMAESNDGKLQKIREQLDDVKQKLDNCTTIYNRKKCLSTQV